MEINKQTIQEYLVKAEVYVKKGLDAFYDTSFVKKATNFPIQVKSTHPHLHQCLTELYRQNSPDTETPPADLAKRDINLFSRKGRAINTTIIGVIILCVAAILYPPATAVGIGLIGIGLTALAFNHKETREFMDSQTEEYVNRIRHALTLLPKTV